MSARLQPATAGHARLVLSKTVLFSAQVCTVFETGLLLIVGTHVKFKIIQCLRTRRRCSVGVINVDDIILFEHLINLLNIPIVLAQMLRVLFPFSGAILI